MILSDLQQQIREMARRFAQERLAPGAARRDRERGFPRDELQEMGTLGLLGMLVPEVYGGSDTGTLAYAAAVEAQARDGEPEEGIQKTVQELLDICRLVRAGTPS